MVFSIGIFCYNRRGARSFSAEISSPCCSLYCPFFYFHLRTEVYADRDKDSTSWTNSEMRSLGVYAQGIGCM